jgi:hypothetical protein
LAFPKQVAGFVATIHGQPLAVLANGDVQCRRSSCQWFAKRNLYCIVWIAMWTPRYAFRLAFRGFVCDFVQNHSLREMKDLVETE